MTMASLSYSIAANDVAVDIEAELRLWRTIHPDEPLHKQGLEFKHYVPTLKFGYDAYLLNYRTSLQDVLPALKTRYVKKLLASEQLDWTHAEVIIKSVWRRMSSAESRQRRSAGANDSRDRRSDLAR